MKVHKAYSEKNVFVFDWDGTLFDSMGIKRNNFVTAFAFVFPDIEESLSSVRQSYVELSGKPRKELFMDVANEMNCQPNDDKYSSFNEKFSELNMAHLVTAPVFSDAMGFLMKLIANKMIIYISSSAPETELKHLVDKVLPDACRVSMAGVLGTTDYHHKGTLHINRICAETKIDRSGIIFFGDDYEDELRSREAGVDCVIIDREERLTNKVENRVKSFYEVQEFLDG